MSIATMMTELVDAWDITLTGRDVTGWELTISERGVGAKSFTYRGPSLLGVVSRAYAGEVGE